MTIIKRSIEAAVAMLFMASPVAADTFNPANTAWVLTSSALVLFMTLPGLSLFYGGLVRSKNVLSVLMQCFAITCLVSLLWLAGVYSFVFADGGTWQPFLGGGSKSFLPDLGVATLTGDIPESVFFMFQMTFAIITPALIVGGFAERMKFSAMLWFSGLWLILVYMPICHWIWGGGWLAALGAKDFAGGIVIHVNAGVAALVAAIVLGRRRGFPTVAMPPHNMTMVVTGAGMLWFGWFGFNGGSALKADGSAGMAIIVTHVAAAAGALTWMIIEWVRFGKPSVLGIVTGMVAGLGTITPASGYVGPLGGLVIGIIAGIVCFYATHYVKRTLKIDDSLDVFPDARGWVVALADMPGIQVETLRQVAAALHDGALIAAPHFHGRRGHPVGFSAKLGDALMMLQGDQGAKSVLRTHAQSLTRIDCEDPGILWDIDHPEDLLNPSP